MEQLAAEARAVVTQLRKRVTARRARWQPRPLPAPPVRLPMTADPSLEYLHGHWALPDSPAPAAPGPMWKRLVWRVAGRFVFGALTSYLHQERELLSRVVQVCDTLAKRVDTLEADIEQLAMATSRQLAELASYLPDPESAPGASEQAEPEADPDADPGHTSGTARDPIAVAGAPGAAEASQTSPPATPSTGRAAKPRTSTPAASPTPTRPRPRAKPSPAPPRRKRAGPEQ